MSNLTETSNFDTGVYQIETTDNVIGGAGGIANLQAQALANRTKWLHDNMVGTNSPAFTGNPTAPTPAQFDNDTSLATTAFVQRALGNHAGTSVYNSAGTMTAADWGCYVAVSSTSGFTLTTPSVTGVPSGSSMTFFNSNTGSVTLSASSGLFYFAGGSAATITLAPRMACRVTWDGSNFIVVNSDYVQTVAQFDNSTRAASTAFVQRALGNNSNFTGLSTNTTLTAANAGSTIQLTGTTYTVTLPAANAVASGSRIEFLGANSGTVTVQRAGTDNIYNPGTSTVTSIGMTLGDTLVLESNGTSWYQVAGNLGDKYASGFKALLSGTGYQKLPSGLIIQWGRISVTVGVDGSASFPLTFPSACASLAINFELSASSNNGFVMRQGAASTTGFNYYWDHWATVSSGVGVWADYIAVGY